MLKIILCVLMVVTLIFSTFLIWTCCSISGKSDDKFNENNRRNENE